GAGNGGGIGGKGTAEFASRYSRHLRAVAATVRSSRSLAATCSKRIAGVPMATSSPAALSRASGVLSPSCLINAATFSWSFSREARRLKKLISASLSVAKWAARSVCSSDGGSSAAGAGGFMPTSTKPRTKTGNKAKLRRFMALVLKEETERRLKPARCEGELTQVEHTNDDWRVSVAYCPYTPRRLYPPG